MPLHSAQTRFDITTTGCRFHMQDMADNPVTCFVSHEALRYCAGRDSLQPNITVGELFVRYRFEVEDIASTKYDSGLRGAGDDTVHVTTADLSD